jgi:hypothetical protein
MCNHTDTDPVPAGCLSETLQGISLKQTEFHYFTRRLVLLSYHRSQDLTDLNPQ